MRSTASWTRLRNLEEGGQGHDRGLWHFLGGKRGPHRKGIAVKQHEMKTISRIRFNPETRGIEVEGSEQFVKTYSGKLQAMLSWSRAAEQAADERKAAMATGRKPAKRPDKSGQVLVLIRKSRQGITTAGLMKKTGLTDKQGGPSCTGQRSRARSEGTFTSRHSPKKT